MEVRPCYDNHNFSIIHYPINKYHKNNTTTTNPTYSTPTPLRFPTHYPQRVHEYQLPTQDLTYPVLVIDLHTSVPEWFGQIKTVTPLSLCVPLPLLWSWSSIYLSISAAWKDPHRLGGSMGRLCRVFVVIVEERAWFLEGFYPRGGSSSSIFQ